MLLQMIEVSFTVLGQLGATACSRAFGGFVIFITALPTKGQWGSCLLSEMSVTPHIIAFTCHVTNDRGSGLIGQISQPIILCQLCLYSVFNYLGRLANCIGSGLV